MISRTLFLSALLGLLTLPALAADVTGKWVSQQMREGRAATISYDLKQSGDTVTGAVINQRGMASAISEGKVKGNQISFAMVRKAEDKEYRFEFKGVIEGDEIKFEQIGPNGKMPDFTAKRAK